MTRARALKSVIRSRIAKTGERYTTARRHVLAARPPDASRVAPRRPGAHPYAGADWWPPRAASPMPPSRASTGHGLDHWFAMLDDFGAVEQGHTAAARHLYATHQVPGWYAQGITVAYERARGVRAVNQRRDGVYEVSATKMVAAGTREVVDRLQRCAATSRWTKGSAPDLAKALAAALRAPASKGFVVRADGQARYRYRLGRHRGAGLRVPEARRQVAGRRRAQQAGLGRRARNPPRAVARGVDPLAAHFATPR